MSYPQAAPKKRRRWPWYTLASLVALIVIISVAANGGSTPPNGPTANTGSATAPDTIVYTVTGGQSHDITYVLPGESFQQSQITDQTALPWSKTWTAASGSYLPTLLSIVAQNAASGTIGCTISINGAVVAQNSSSGAYSVVTCTNAG